MSDNIQTNTTGRLTPCLQKKIDKTTYLVEVHFSAASTQSVEEKLKRVILHDLEHGKQGRPRKSDEYVLDRQQQAQQRKELKKPGLSSGKRGCAGTHKGRDWMAQKNKAARCFFNPLPCLLLIYVRKEGWFTAPFRLAQLAVTGCGEIALPKSLNIS